MNSLRSNPEEALLQWETNDKSSKRPFGRTIILRDQSDEGVCVCSVFNLQISIFPARYPAQHTLFEVHKFRVIISVLGTSPILKQASV